jgi:propionate CoA-transferase
MKKNKIATADEAISAIKDGDVMAAAGFVGNGTLEELLIALKKCYLDTGQPSSITLLFWLRWLSWAEKSGFFLRPLRSTSP